MLRLNCARPTLVLYSSCTSSTAYCQVLQYIWDSGTLSINPPRTFIANMVLVLLTSVPLKGLPYTIAGHSCMGPISRKYMQLHLHSYKNSMKITERTAPIQIPLFLRFLRAFPDRGLRVTNVRLDSLARRACSSRT